MFSLSPSLSARRRRPLSRSLISCAALSGGRARKLRRLCPPPRRNDALEPDQQVAAADDKAEAATSKADSQVDVVYEMSDPGTNSNMQQLVAVAPLTKVSGGESGKELVARASGGESGKGLVLVEGGGKSSGGVKLREDEEDLELKLRRIMENVPVRVSNTSGSSAGSGSGDFHQYRQMRRREQDRITRMETDYEKRKQEAEFNLRREERLKAAEERTAKKRLKRQKKKQRKKEKRTITSGGGEEPSREDQLPVRAESSDDDGEGSDYDGDDKFKQCT